MLNLPAGVLNCQSSILPSNICWGALNTTADALSHMVSLIVCDSDFQLAKMRHEQYGHPGISRLAQLLHQSNDASFPNVEQVCRKVVQECRVCAEIKPRWISPTPRRLINSSAPWQRISLDFMTNKPTSSEGFCNILTVIDEYSRFPFAFATKDRSSTTVIDSLNVLFCLFGPPVSVHSDHGVEFFSANVMTFLSEWGVHHSRTTSYHPAGNGQVERFNGIIWQTTKSLLADRQLPGSAWPVVLREALHCIRSLVSSSTNSTPHNLFFNFDRNFRPLPNAISPGEYAWLHRHIHSKNDASGEIVKIVASYPRYAVVSRDGIHTVTVNWCHLAHHPSS